MKRKLQNIAYLLMAAALITSCGEKKQTAEFTDWAWADFQRPEGINPIIFLLSDATGLNSMGSEWYV